MADPKIFDFSGMSLEDIEAQARALASAEPPKEVLDELDALAGEIRPGNREAVAAFMRRVVEVYGAARGLHVTQALLGVAPGETSDEFISWLEAEFPIEDGAEVIF